MKFCAVSRNLIACQTIIKNLYYLFLLFINILILKIKKLNSNFNFLNKK